MPPPSDQPPQHQGIRVGAAVAQLLAQALVAARHHTSQLDVEQQIKAQELYHERYEPTLVSAMRPLLEQLAASPAVHEAIGNVAGDMASMRGQIQGMMLSFTIPFLLGEGLSPILAPFAQALENEAWTHLVGSGQSEIAVPLSPAQLADMVVRGILPQSEAETIAAMSGTTATDLDLMVQDTGEPPAVQELLFAYRRGIIDQGRLEHGIRQGRTKNEWIDVVEALRYQPMTPATAVAAAVQGHLTDGEARRIWAEGGFDPADYDAAYQTAGRPPGPAQLLDLLNRGIIGEPEFIAAVRESDIKDKYIPLLLELRKYLPPPRTVTTLLKEGAITQAQALRLLADYGVQPADAAGYLKGAASQKVTKQKALAVTTIEALYHDRLVTRPQAEAMIVSLGYTQPDANFILTVQDLKREQAYAERAIGAVHTQYVGHKLSEVEARAVLQELGVDAAGIGHLITLWTHEQLAHVRVLTPAQWVAAVKLNLATDLEALAALKALGYSDRDARLTIDIGLKSEVLPLPPNV